MEVFNWPIKPGMGTESSPRVRTVRFGDGYEQRKPDGLNSQFEKFNVTLSLTPEKADKALDFLKRHGGVKSFLFQPKKSKPSIIVVCRKWTYEEGNTRTNISAEFEEISV